MPDTGTTRRLVFAKYLQRTAANQSRLPEPLCAAAILTLHDAVELLLQIASESLNVGDKRTEFMRYFELIDNALAPHRLEGRESMRRLNSARIALKHHGTSPARSEVTEFSTIVAEFFRNAMQVVFGEDYDAIRLSSLVHAADVRECLDAADQAFTDQRHEDALAKLGEAFVRLKGRYRLEARWSSDLAVATRGISALLAASHVDSRGAERLVKAVEAIGEEVTLLRHGIDTRQLKLFSDLTPHVALTASGQVQVSRFGGTPAHGAEAVGFCFTFVLDAAMRMQQVHSLMDTLGIDHYGRVRFAST